MEDQVPGEKLLSHFHSVHHKFPKIFRYLFEYNHFRHLDIAFKLKLSHEYNSEVLLIYNYDRVSGKEVHAIRPNTKRLLSGTY